MSANGKSCDGGGGEDADDEDGVQNNAEGKIPNKEQKAVLKQKTKNAKNAAVASKPIST